MQTGRLTYLQGSLGVPCKGQRVIVSFRSYFIDHRSHIIEVIAFIKPNNPHGNSGSTNCGEKFAVGGAQVVRLRTDELHVLVSWNYGWQTFILVETKLDYT